MRPVAGILGGLVSGLALISLAGCGTESVAGKTTTTSNGGDLYALGPDGRPLAGCVALAARSWNPLTGTPGVVDTLQGDAEGRIALEQDSYAVLEIRDGSSSLGTAFRRLALAAGERRTVSLDTLRSLEGRWADHGAISRGRLYLDSSFQTATLRSSDGAFAFAKLPRGEYRLMLDADTQSIRPMGRVRFERGEVRYTGSGNILLAGDTTGSPLWIDDFESGTYWPLLRQSLPGISPWFMWWVEADMVRPGGTLPDSILAAIGPDATRGGRTFQARFRTTSEYGLVAAGLTNMELDLQARSQVCFAYRTDSTLRIEFQRDSVGTTRPTLSSSLPPSRTWRDICAPIADFRPTSETPDSLASWNTFGKRVLVLQFLATGGATYLDLDDIRLR